MAEECADLAIGMMLASARQIVAADRFVRSGEWLKGPISLGHSVAGKTVGVVGLGGIGRAIADRAKAFRMDVLWHGPRPKPDVPYEYVADLVAHGAAQRFPDGGVPRRRGDTRADLRRRARSRWAPKAR